MSKHSIIMKTCITLQGHLVAYAKSTKHIRKILAGDRSKRNEVLTPELLRLWTTIHVYHRRSANWHWHTRLVTTLARHTTIRQSVARVDRWETLLCTRRRPAANGRIITNSLIVRWIISHRYCMPYSVTKERRTASKRIMDHSVETRLWKRVKNAIADMIQESAMKIVVILVMWMNSNWGILMHR